jgi:hypothetical protein
MFRPVIKFLPAGGNRMAGKLFKENPPWNAFQ